MLTEILARCRPSPTDGPTLAAESSDVSVAPLDRPFAKVARGAAPGGRKGSAQKELERRRNESGE